jgi:ABC-type multidrug transport system fused ATPase/permease subunit
MSIANGHAQATFPSRAISNLRSTLQSDDPVALGLRESARRMIGIAVFSGVINILMLSGSLYMLQVYDRVIPSRNTATLLGLSLMVLFAYLVQGYFDALRTRMLCRVATLFDAGLQQAIHTALATLPLRGVKPMLMQQPLRDLDQVRGFMSSMGPTAFLDMPWIPIFLIALFLFHPAIGMTALLGTAAIIAMTLLTERMSRGAAKAAMDSSAQRQVLADATQRNAEVIRALGMTDRFTARWSQANERYLRENIRATDVYANLGSGAKVLRYVLQSGMLGIGAYLVVADRASGGIMIASSIMMGRASRHRAAARDMQGHRAAAAAAGSAAAPLSRTFGAGTCRRRPGGNQANRLEHLVFPQGRHGTGAARRKRFGQDLAFQGAGRNLVGPEWRGAARRCRARSMAKRRSRTLYRLPAAGRGLVRWHRRREHLPFRRDRSLRRDPAGRAGRRRA